jgi:hypothetical protein
VTGGPAADRAPEAGGDEPTLTKASGSPGWSLRRPYSDDSPWNTPLPDDAPIHPASDELVARIGAQLTSDVEQYTMPVYEVDADTPTVPVRVQHLFSEVVADGTEVERRQEVTVDVPLPPDAIAAEGTDAQVVVLDVDTGDEWGFWQLAPDGDGFTATNGYRYNLAWNGVPPDGFGSRGAGVTYLAGLIRPASIDAGEIDHAIAFAYPTPSPEHVWPATKSDGQGEAGLDLPEGARLRLDPSLTESDLRDLGLDDAGVTIARALQTYGMILIDVAGRPKIYGEYEGTAAWSGTITEDTVSALPVEAFDVVDWDALEPEPMAQPTAAATVVRGSELVLRGTASYDPAGRDVVEHVWFDADGEELGTGEVLRLGTDELAVGGHRVGLQVETQDGRRSTIREVGVTVEERDGPFVASVSDAAAVEADLLELTDIAAEDDAEVTVAVAIRRVNEQDDTEVVEIDGLGRTWTREVRQLDGRGTLALEVWTGTVETGGDADADDAVTVQLSAATNVAGQVVVLADVEPAETLVGEATDDSTAATELAVAPRADGLVLTFHAGRTEDLEPDGAAEPVTMNTEADAGGGSVRLSSLLHHVEAGDELTVGGTTRSPMDWAAASLLLPDPR